MIFHQIEIVVVESDLERTLGGRDVEVSVTSTAGRTVALYDENLEVFHADRLRPGEYVLAVAGRLVEPHTERVQIHPAPTKLRVRVDLASQPTIAPESFSIGVLPDAVNHPAEEVEAGLERLIAEAGLEVVPAAPDLEPEPLRHYAVQALKGTPRPLAHAEDFDRALRCLRDDKVVRRAQAYVRRGTAPVGELTDRLYVLFKPDVTQEVIDDVFDRHGLSAPQTAPGDGALYLARAPAGFALRTVRLAREIRAEETVLEAETLMIDEGAQDDAVLGAAMDGSAQDRADTGALGTSRSAGAGRGRSVLQRWDRHLIRLPARKSVGIRGDDRQPPAVTVFDRDVVPEEEIARHSDLANARLRSVNGLTTAPASSSSGHGLMCAGLIASPTLGVAPDADTTLVADPRPPDDHVEAFRWAAGLRPWPADPETDPGVRPAWIISSSHALHTLSLGAASMLRELVRVGRRGKGCSLFFSAGNLGADIAGQRPYGASPFTLSIAASTVDPAGLERVAEYSGWGDVELSVPSGSRIRGASFGDLHHGVVVPYRPHQGWVPSDPPLVETFTLAHAGQGQGEIRLADTDGLVPEAHLLLVAPDGRWHRTDFKGESDLGGGRIEIGTELDFALPMGSKVYSPSRAVGKLRSDTDSGQPVLPLHDAAALRRGERLRIRSSGDGIGDDLSYTVRDGRTADVVVEESPEVFPAGTVVYRDESHRILTSGTSTSTPICAGVAALMLEAEPELTWIELRHLLRRTARKIDFDTSDPISRWLGRDGRPSSDESTAFYSRRYGFGRLDAAEAVAAARAYEFPRDLMVRRGPKEDGTTRRRKVGESPDVWVRRIDPMTAAEKSLVRPRHENARRNHDDWIFVRVRNRGTAPSLEAWVRVYVAAGQDAPYRFPDDFPSNLGKPRGAWPRGSYCIAEVAISGVPPGDSQVVWLRWPAEQKPPAMDPEGRPWDPRLLVEVTPLDGPLTGDSVLDCNNLAQRRVEILDPTG